MVGGSVLHVAFWPTLFLFWSPPLCRRRSAVIRQVPLSVLITAVPTAERLRAGAPRPLASLAWGGHVSSTALITTEATRPQGRPARRTARGRWAEPTEGGAQIDDACEKPPRCLRNVCDLCYLCEDQKS